MQDDFESHDDSERGLSEAASALHERDALASYLADIGSIPTLSRDEEVQLAGEIEEAGTAFRDAITRMPWLAHDCVRRWGELRTQDRVTGRMSERFGQPGEGPEVSRRVDDCVAKLERVLARRTKILGVPDTDSDALARTDRRMARLLAEIDLSQRVLMAARRRLLTYRSEFAEIAAERASLGSPQRKPRSAAGRSRRRAELRALTERRKALEGQVGLPQKRYLELCAEMEAAFQRLTERKNHFARHNVKLVVAIAKEFRNSGLPLRDMIQEGNIGLLRAVEKFDHRRGFKFSTYAIWWIRQALIRALQNHSRTIRLPSHLHDSLRRYRRERDRLERELGRELTAEEAADIGHLEPSLAADLELVARDPVSLDAPAVAGEEDRRLVDRIADPNEPDPGEEIDAALLEHATRRALEVLPPRERQILQWRFGLAGEEATTLEEIGHRLGLSRERVRQLEKRALHTLRGGQAAPLQELLSEEVA